MSDPLAPEGYNKPGHSYCWCHYEPERVTRWTYIVCFECGHVWSWLALKVAYVRMSWRMDSSLRYRMKAISKPVSRIRFCQECIHDF